MEKIIFIDVPSADRAMMNVLGERVLVRTVKVLLSAGAEKIFLTGAGALDVLAHLPKQVSLAKAPHQNGLNLSANFHYDPSLLRDLMKSPPLSMDELLARTPANLWHSLDDNNAVKNISNKLFSVIRQNTEGWVAKGINKTISFAITRFLVRTNITPNQITFVNLLIAFLAFFLLMSPSYLGRVLGAFLMAFSSIVDGCDGEVARLKLMTSKFGAWFDTIADDFSNNLFVVGLSLGPYRETGQWFYLDFGSINLVLSLGVTAIIYHQLINSKKEGNAKDFKPVWDKPQAGGRKSLFEMIRPLMKRDFFIVVILFFVLIDQRPIVFWISCIATFITFALYITSFLMEFEYVRYFFKKR